MSKRSTQSGARSYLKRLKAAFEKRDMRQIDAGDVQRLISGMDAEGLNAKTIRNAWGVISVIWNAALAQKYVDALLPKPKLPRRPKAKPKFFTLAEVSKLIAASEREHKVFYWLAAETGLRAGEVAGLKLSDIDGERLFVNRSVWNGQLQNPKTVNALRPIALSPQLVTLLWEQIARQKAKEHEFLFTTAAGTPWDMNVYRQRKMKKLLSFLELPPRGFHAFRHFNVSLLDALRVPLKVIQERLGHAFTGSFTLDVYGGQPEWKGNVEAAQKLGAAIEEAVQNEKQTAHVDSFVSLTAINENGLQSAKLEAAEN